MKSRQERKIEAGARAYLEAGEELLAAVIARPRGWTRAAASAGVGGVAGAIARELGSKADGPANAAAGGVGFELASPMALAITPRRLIVLAISSPIGFGIGGAVKGVVSAASLHDVDSIEVKSLPLGKVITVTVRGVPFKLEANAVANARGLASSFDRAKAAA